MQVDQPPPALSAIDDLGALRALVAVVEGGSFSEAGRRLRVVPSTISKQLSSLEERVNCQLIVRSTKRLSVTELGRLFYERAVGILDKVQEADAEAGHYNGEASGILRITAATAFARRHLIPILESFAKKHPKVRIDISLSTETVDIVAEGFDVAIRTAKVIDPALSSITLAVNMRVVCAAPAYLRRRGMPDCAEDLADHNCLTTRGIAESSTWRLLGRDGKPARIPVSGNLCTDSGDLLRDALLAGLGVGHMARYMIHDDLVSGRLVELLPEKRVIDSYIYAVHPTLRSVPLKTRVFLNHLREAFHPPPPWARDDGAARFSDRPAVGPRARPADGVISAGFGRATP